MATLWGTTNRDDRERIDQVVRQVLGQAEDEQGVPMSPEEERESVDREWWRFIAGLAGVESRFSGVPPVTYPSEEP